jgi:Arc/MetJ-type ribon-helix-helix transcriptional regulator
VRAPLTIALGPDSYRFIQACAERKAFRNVDDLFEAALLTYQRQSDALHAYIDMQIDKGFTREEILDSLRVEFVFTRPRSKRKKRSGR